MAEPPIRGQRSDAPTIQTPVAPSPAPTELGVPVAVDGLEATASLQAPDAGLLIGQLLALVASETEALLARDEPGGHREQLAELRVRSALTSWDALHQPEEASRLLELAAEHPLAPRLRFAAALAAGDEAALAAIEPALGAPQDGASARALAIELAEAWLWRHGRLDRAAAVLERVLAAELPAYDDEGDRAAVHELAALVAAATGAWPRVLELRRAALRDDAPPEEVAATAALLLDRAGDPAGALALCWSKLEHFASAWASAGTVVTRPQGAPIEIPRGEDMTRRDEIARVEIDEATEFRAWDGTEEMARLHSKPGSEAKPPYRRALREASDDRAGAAGPPRPATEADELTEHHPHAPGDEGRRAAALGWLRTLDIALDAAMRLDDARRFALLEQRAALVDGLANGEPLALATRHALASELERDGQAIEAAKLWERLADEEAAAAPAAAQWIALARAGWAAARAEPVAPGIALAAHRRLAESACSEAATAHAWRALELAAVTGDPAVDALARAVADASDSPAAQRWLDQLELAAPGDAAIARFEARGGHALRWAAAIAERALSGSRTAAPGELEGSDPADRATALSGSRTSAPGQLDSSRDPADRATALSGSRTAAPGQVDRSSDSADRATALSRSRTTVPNERTGSSDPADRATALSGSRTAAPGELASSGDLADRAIALWELAAAVRNSDDTRGALGVRTADNQGAAPSVRTSDTAILPTTRDHAARLHRGGDGEALAAAYAVWAAAEPDARCAAVLWCARGIVDLGRGDFVEAEGSLRRAAELAPADAFCRAALAEVFRAGKQFEPLADVLGELATALVSRGARAAAMREHAELLDEHLGDPAGARAALERMLVERPDDLEAMLALAKLCERAAAWDRAVELRQRAAALAPAARAGDIWIGIARAEELRGDTGAALTALGQAAAAGHTAALGEQARLHVDAGDPERALAVVREELAADPSLDRRMQLQGQLAQLLTALDREPEAVVAAYLDVLSLEPDQSAALAGIEAPARALGLWDELARAFRGAPQTPHNLGVLGEALAEIAEWSELAEVRRRQLEAATTPAEQAQRAAELARLYERELGDSDAAIRMLVVAQTAQADDARQRELLRLLRGAERWPEVAAMLERELPQVPEANVERQLEILLELADLRANRLDRRADAVLAYESVLERRPLEPVAMAALEALYEQLGRERDLARLLEQRAEAATDATERTALFARVAALRTTRGDVDGAIAAYAAAFEADPSNRDVFTALERVCYKAERWAAAMQLYERAIAFVEGGHPRSYRLGDLYARRGNVQLNFLGQTDAAMQAYQRVIEVDSQPQTAAGILEELCKRRGDFDPLIAAFERRAETQRDPQRKLEALRTAAALSARHLATAQGGAPQALRLHQKLLELDPLDANAAAMLERYYDDVQDKSGLVHLLKQGLPQARDAQESVELLGRIARVSEEGGRDVVTATEHYRKMLELQPENRDALEALGRIYESTEQWAEFIDITRKQIKVTSDRNTKALLYFRCGSVMEAKFGREQDAIRYYDAAIKTSPSCLPAVHGLRDLYRRREEWPRVIETLELEVKLWQDDKERAGVFAQIGRIYEHQLADVDRALHYYESALTVDPDCLPANQALFEYFFDRGAWDKAQPIANLLSQKATRDGDPTTRSDFYRKRGVVARMTGDPRGAAESIIVALEIRPTSADALDDLGTLARERPDAWDFELTYRELDKLYKRRDDAGPLLARVHVGRAAIREREGDLDQAAELYRQALELAPGDLTVLSAVVDFHTDMRRWPDAVAAIARFLEATSTAADRLAAMMRQATIHADCELDPERAIAVLGEIIELEPAHQDAHYLLAQQHYLLARHADARAAIDRVIELATSPGQPLSATALARYYYYKGRIADAAGDARAAAPQYRRAIDYDPGYAPPALVLARRAADGGDQRQAETLLIDAAHAAMAHGGQRAAVPLQRGLARILLASGDRAAAIEAYRGILNVEPDGASDRVALAEIYAVDDAQRAIGELRKVLDRDIHHAPAYRMLASFYHRTGDAERAHRVLTALDLLGFAEDADRTAIQRLRSARVAAALRRPLDDEHRDRFLLTPAARAPLGEVFGALAEELSGAIAQPSLGANLQPAHPSREPHLIQLAAEVGALYGGDLEIFIGDKVPGLAAATAFPRRLLVIDRALLGEPEPALRFLLGYAFEAIRGRYAILLQVGARQRRELAQLLRSLLAPAAERTGPAADLATAAPQRAARVLERHAGLRDVDPGAWIDGMLALAKRAGLLACDDFSAAIWMVARLAGEQLANHDATVALGSVLGGPDLVRFYLSDDYQHLRDTLAV